MSRTYRNTQHIHRYAYRFPQTFNEIKRLDAILTDDEIQEFSISKINRMKSREHNLPTAWDDQVVSAYYETDFKL